MRQFLSLSCDRCDWIRQILFCDWSVVNYALCGLCLCVRAERSRWLHWWDEVLPVWLVQGLRGFRWRFPDSTELSGSPLSDPLENPGLWPHSPQCLVRKSEYRWNREYVLLENRNLDRLKCCNRRKDPLVFFAVVSVFNLFALLVRRIGMVAIRKETCK